MKRLRFKNFMRERTDLSVDGEETLLSVSEYYGVKPKKEVSDEADYLSRAESLEGYRRVTCGDLVMNYMLAWKGAYGVSDHDGIVSPAYAVFSIDTRLADLRYIHHRVRSDPCREMFRASSKGIIDSRLRLYPDAFLALAIELPDLPVQRTIADFLDRETARIDQLIKGKERQRIVISERRDAVAGAIFGAQLSSARTAALRRFASSMCDGPFGSSLKSEHYVDHGVRVVRLQNIGLRRFLDEDVAFIDPIHYATLGDHDVVPGDLLVASLGDPNNPVGRACIASSDLGPAMVKADCFRVRLDQRQLRHDYVASFLSSPAGIEQTAQHAKGVTRDRINLSILASLMVPIPTLAEQQATVSTLSDMDAKVTVIDSKIGASIDRLRELRVTLIAAAVTGQLDVATWGKRGTTDRRLDEIEAAMTAVASPGREEVRV